MDDDFEIELDPTDIADEGDTKTEEGQIEEDEEFIEIGVNEHDTGKSAKIAYYTYVPPNERFSSNCVTLYEKARLISVRAQQIAKASHRIFCESYVGDTHVKIAERELFEQRCPLLLYRVVGYDRATGNKTVEVWDPKQMVIPH